LRINENTAKQIAANFFQRENHGVSPVSAVLKENSWLVSVNILNPKNMLKKYWLMQKVAKYWVIMN